MAGLSQDEKKSSGSPAGVAVPSADASIIMSVITTPSGYLQPF